MSWRTRLPLLLLLCSSAATLSGCDEEKSYSYFFVKMDLDPQTVDDEVRVRVASCALLVEGSDQDQVAIPRCRLGATPYDLGTADFSSEARTGMVRFVIKAFNFDGKVMAEGASAYVGVVPNRPVSTMVTASLVGAPPDTVDAGGNSNPDVAPPASDAAPGDAATD